MRESMTETIVERNGSRERERDNVRAIERRLYLVQVRVYWYEREVTEGKLYIGKCEHKNSNRDI